MRWSINLDKKKRRTIPIIVISVICSVYLFKFLLTNSSHKTTQTHSKKTIQAPKQEVEKLKSPQLKRPKEIKHEASEDLPSLSTLKLKTFIESCPKLREVLNREDKIVDYEPFARNYHYQRNGEIYRIRVFTEDGENGGFSKIVYYKEDSDGFPIIEKTKEIRVQRNKNLNQTINEEIDKTIGGSQIIYNAQDIHYTMNSGQEMSVSFENNKIKKIIAKDISCLL